MCSVGIKTFLIGLMLLSQLSCRTIGPSSQSKAAPGSEACTANDLRTWVLSLVFPKPVPNETRDCLRRVFSRMLEKEKRDTNGPGNVDAFDEKQMLAKSSLLLDDAYSEKNLVDLRVYQRGPEIFAAHRRLIGRASEEVLFQTYVWESSSASAQEILNGIKDLETRRKESCSSSTCLPVQVRLIINYGPTALGPLGNLLGQPLVNGAAEADESVKKLNLDPKVVNVKVATYSHQAFGSNHVKTLVVDGQIAMITGANAQRFNDADVNWYDTGYIVGGEIAKGLRVDLINALIRANQGTEKDGNNELATEYGTPYNKTFETVYPVRELMREPYGGGQQLIPMLITSRLSEGNPLIQSNNSTQNRGFQAAFYGASERIRVLTPNLNDDAAIRGLAQAVRRGVKVEMILSRRFNCSSQNQVGQGGQNAKAVNRLLAEIRTATPQGAQHDLRWFSMIKDGRSEVVNDNAAGRKPEERPNNSHAKFMAIDGRLVIIGSANMDTQSWNQSRELNLLVFDPTVTRAWEDQVFGANFAIAQPIGSEELQPEKISCDP